MLFQRCLINVIAGFSLALQCYGLRVPTPSVWSVFGDLAGKTGACNLGQGFPDWQSPKFVLDALQRTTSHQYTRSSGFIPLVNLLAARYGAHLNHYVDPMTNIAVTVGASQALYLALTTMLKEHDEVVMFDPYFELYSKQIALTKATQVFVPLGGSCSTQLNPWALDVDALKRYESYDTNFSVIHNRYSS